MQTVGILGAGQLARMLALAAYPLGLRVLAYGNAANPCVQNVCPVIHGEFTDLAAIKLFCEQVDVVTYENENIPLETAEFIASHFNLFPSVRALSTTQDRWVEKNVLRELDIPTNDFYKIDSYPDLVTALQSTGYPAVLKTRRLGYDGKGQTIIHNSDAAKSAWAQSAKQDLILESFVHFAAEVSQITTSNQRDHKFYPLVDNVHVNGILQTSSLPSQWGHLAQQAQAISVKLLNHFTYTGVLSVEFFVHNNRLLVNEMAPRVHNSGHWSIEGAACSQFENHLRAICGLPLGEIHTTQACTLFNAIGTMPAIEPILAIDGAHYHSYNKKSQPQRKVGHINLMKYNELQFTQATEDVLTAIKTSCVPDAK